MVVSDVHGHSARAMCQALIAAQPVHEVRDLKGRLRASREVLLEALSTDELSAAHRFVAQQIMDAFGSAERLASWVSICPGSNESAGKRKTGRIRKGYKKSVVAIAHKMLRIIYAMLSQGVHCQGRSVDYEALNVARNALRWIRMLKKHGFIAQAGHA